MRFIWYPGAPAATHGASPFTIRASLAAFVIALAVAALFMPVVNHQFLLWDDPIYVTRNHEIADGLTWRGLVWALSEFHAANWHPLTWLSHMVDVELWGMWSGGHHLTSVFWHAVNAGLLFALLYRLTGAFWRSTLVALAFGVHPLHVESVAWVAERKDVLSGFFWLLTLLLYERYARLPGLGRYLAVTAAFVAGLMSKPMLVTLPIIMLLLDVWPLNRVGTSTADCPWWRGPAFRSVVAEKLPWLAVAMISGVITLRAQTSAIVPAAVLPWDERLPMATIAYATYLWQTMLPLDLSFFYRPDENWSTVFATATGTLVIVSGAVVYAWRRANPAPLIGWAWYLIALLPVIGIIKVGPQAHADRYTYLPLIGIFLAAAFAVPMAARVQFRWRWSVSAGAAVLLVFWTALSWRQIGYWATDETLYTRAIELDPGNYVAHLQLGEAHHLRGRPLDSEVHVRKALAATDAPMVRFYGNILLGNLAYDRRWPAAALAHYQRALAELPESPLAHYNVGTAWLTLGDARQAERHFLAAVRGDSRYSDAWANLGVARVRLGDPEQARRAYVTALEYHPGNSGARFNLARLEMQSGRLGEARMHLTELLHREPGHQRARQALASLPASAE